MLVKRFKRVAPGRAAGGLFLSSPECPLLRRPNGVCRGMLWIMWAMFIV